uniref:C2H2-type domain-containing protein n=1 Tax=Anopheles farauti TaxID=69004 RepID=A0A182Q3N5_9DIPT
MMQRRAFCFTVLLLVWQVYYAVSFDCDGNSTSIDDQLKKELLCSNYDKSQRPVKDHTTCVNITMLMNVKNFHVVESKPSVYISVWMTFEWRDEFLHWSRAKYGLDKITVSPSDIWQPTIASFNEQSVGTPENSCRNFECEVKLNGNVSCTSPCSYQVNCESTNAAWPFDTLTCSLYLSSWLETINQLNITEQSNVSLQHLTTERSSWKLLVVNKLINVVPEMHNYYMTMEYVFKFERHTGVYTAILMPGFVMVAVCLTVLWLNSRSNERLYTLCATCMGHFSYIQFIYLHIPEHSMEVPSLCAVNCDSSNAPETKEGKLLQYLYCNKQYDKSERPVKDHNTAVNVSAVMHIQNYDVSEEKSTLFLYVWMSLSWRDQMLVWDRTEYGVDKLIIDSDELWRPTFLAFHNLKSGNGDSACANHRCEVNQTGNVLCVPPCQYEALCVSNTVNWPFDDLQCTMFLGTWLEDFNEINISRKSNVSTRHIEVQHAEWKLQSSKILHIFLPDNTSYPALEYIFTLERHVAIYGAILTPGFLLFFRDSLIINVIMVTFTIVLRHTGPKADDSSERLVDKLANKVASTGLGRVFLQTDDATDGKSSGTSEDENNEREDVNRAEHADGDTVNLVVDASEHAAPVSLAGSSADQKHANVVTIFMDRVMFVCFTCCYVFMICNLLPKEMK